MIFHLIKEWIQYFHLKVDEHALHSPFFYDFYRDLLKEPQMINGNIEIENLRKEFLESTQEIEVNDLGAGSQIENTPNRKVSNIAKYSLSSTKFSVFLYRLIKKYKLKNILELGTSLGINTAYMALAKDVQIVSMEGDESIIQLAEKHLNKKENINLMFGNIDGLLPNYLKGLNEPLDLVYIDANHTYEATIRYFKLLLKNKHQFSIFIFDDIHWSSGMTKAWKEIKKHSEVTASIDLFDAGIIFFNQQLNQQHLVLNF